MAKVLAICCLWVVAAGLHVRAQQAREVFGKNRIQYRSFDWQYLTGENFDVYYYDGRRDIATQALQYLELEFDRITDLIGYAPYYKAKVFIYNSMADLRQSNVGLNHTYYNINGEVDFIKPYVEVAHQGTAQEFKDELLFNITSMLVNEMMYGGSLKDIFQSALLLNLPDWFVSGVAMYVARGWTAEMDDYVRQIITTRNVNKFNRFTDKEAALIGQSAWNFIVERYGKSSVSNILNYTRITRNEEKSIMITLGVSYTRLVEEWRQYYSQMERSVSQSYIKQPDSTKFESPHNRYTEFTTLKVSPDGRYLAYAENDRGSYTVKVRSLENNKETTILRGGSRVIGQRVDNRLPLISWADASTLGVVAVKRGEYTFWLYDLNTRTKLPRELDRFDNVRSLSFSGNGRLVILSADFEGQNDLFLLSTRRDRLRRLTNDLYDDLDPGFIPGTNRIVWSSNRVNDTLRTRTKPVLGDLTDNYNLFVYDLDTTNQVVARITNTLSKDYAPVALNDNIFYYLSDQRGIINLFKFDRTTGIYTQVTNYATSIREYDFNADRDMLAMISQQRLRDNIFIDKSFNLNRNVFTPATRRKELQQARIIRDRKRQEESKNMTIKDLLNARLKETQLKTDSLPIKDSVPVISDTAKITIDSTALVKTDTLKPSQEPVINTDNYVFEDEVIKQPQPSETFLNRYMRARDKNRIMGPFPYESKFGRESMVTSAVIDPLRGFGFLMEIQMNDMLENYRFYGGLMTSIDLRNGDVYGEFQYLPSFIDFSARFDRKGIRWEPFSGENIYHYSLNKFELGAALPVSDRVRLTVKPFGALTTAAFLGETTLPTQPPSARPSSEYFAGVKSELVYDNSVSVALNIIEGTRGKITYSHWEGLDNSSHSFSQVSADIRHYQKIYREIVLAVRGFGGTFYGKQPKHYLLGGMDNWVFNQVYLGGTSSTGEENPLGTQTQNTDLLFAEFVTNLRGFDYAILFGNNVMLMNAELRVPLFRVLSSAPITSNFFRNMQFIGFYDIGTSWSGKPPFSSGNSVSFRRKQEGSFDIDIKNYLNPWLYSYGFGMRTVMLGYYMKFDLAWPVENYRVGNPRLMVTLGFDF
ncbi:MAG: translocation protein TolB [Cyclobacteriaceae bacterium]|nr:translocation protein TolB [Cyclobacteriaceae bacterium]